VPGRSLLSLRGLVTPSNEGLRTQVSKPPLDTLIYMEG
jgi:hypothetical protein